MYVAADRRVVVEDSLFLRSLQFVLEAVKSLYVFYGGKQAHLVATDHRCALNSHTFYICKCIYLYICAYVYIYSSDATQYVHQHDIQYLLTRGTLWDLKQLKLGVYHLLSSQSASHHTSRWMEAIIGKFNDNTIIY